MVAGLLLGASTPAGRPPDPEPVVEAPAAAVYAFADATSTGDPNAILSTPVTAAGNRAEQCTFVLQTPGTIRVPNATDIGGAYVQWRLKDLAGDEVSVDQLDALVVVAWLNSLTGLLPVGTYVGVAVTAGGVETIGNAGVFVGIRYAAGGNEAVVSGNVGGGVGWGTLLVATQVDALTRGVALKTLMSNSNSAAFRQVIALDAAGIRSSVAGTSPIAPSANIYQDGPFTHVALVCGHSATDGAASKTVVASARSLVQAFEKLVDSGPRLDLPEFVKPTTFSRWLEIGDSNTNSTTIDPVRSVAPGNVIPAGYVVRTGGVNASVYEAGNAPGVGMVPWLIDALIARGVTSGWYARRGTNGADTAWPGTLAGMVINAIADVNALGGEPDAIGVKLGANDAAAINTAAGAARYRRNIRRLALVLMYQFPNSYLIFFKERARAGDESTYPFFATIYADLDELAADYPDRIGLVDAVALNTPMADEIHQSTGATGGQRVFGEAAVELAYS